jgi:uncharacterized membrane protein
MNYTPILNLLLAMLLFASAYYAFDWNDWTQIYVSTVLVLSGIHWLFRDSESPARRRLGRSCLRAAAVISVFVIAKLIIFG